MGEPARKLPNEQGDSYHRPQLRPIQGGGQTGGERPKGHLYSVPSSSLSKSQAEEEPQTPQRHLSIVPSLKDEHQSNKVYDESGAKNELKEQKEKGKLSPSSLKDRESQGSSTSSSAPAERKEASALPSGGFYKPDQEKGGMFSRLRSKAGSKLGKRVGLLFGGMAGLGLLAALLFIFSGLGSFKIIHLAENITAWQMARSARAMRASFSASTTEVIAANQMDESRIRQLATRFTPERLQKANEQVNRFRPEKMFQKLETNTTLVFEDGGPRIFGLGNKKVFTGWKIGDDFIPKADTRFFTPLQNRAERIRMTDQLDAIMERHYRGTNSLVRSAAMKKWLNARGVKFYWWEHLGRKYTGLSQSQAEKLAAADSYKRVSGKSKGACAVAIVCNASDKADDVVREEVDETVKDPNRDPGTGAHQVGENGSTKAANAVSEVVEASVFEKAVGFASTTYAIAVPICLIYDGSITNAGPRIDAAEDAATRQYTGLMSANDQQKAGHLHTTPAAIASFSGLIGSINGSIPQVRANGRSVDTVNGLSALSHTQSSGMGDYSLFDVLLGSIVPHEMIAPLTNAVKSSCGVLTDPRVGAAEAAGEVILAIFTAGATEGGKRVAIGGIRAFMTRILDKIAVSAIRKAIIEKGISSIAQAGGKFILKIVAVTGGTLGATELAKMIVTKQMNASLNGLATDETYANQADMGGNVVANQNMRLFFYGRPLMQEEVAMNNIQDVAYRESKQKQLSIHERYFAMSNPTSLMTRTATFVNSMVAKPRVALTSTIGSLGSVFTKAPALFASSLMPGKNTAMAATVNGAGDYNIVQWGYSAEETALMERPDGEYGELINTMVADQNATAMRAIEDKYGKCYTESMGNLLSQGLIVREPDGKVKQADGLCSPQNLGINNGEFGEHMVFRWRLSKRYANVTQQFEDIQNAQ